MPAENSSVGGIDVPNLGKVEILRPEVFGDMESDKTQSVVVDRSFHVVDVPRIDFNVTEDLISAAPADRSALIEQVPQNLLRFPAGTFPRFSRVVSAS